jgi:hypothetical protein
MQWLYLGASGDSCSWMITSKTANQHVSMQVAA